MRAFVDTNLWIYRFDRREPDKRAFVSSWLRSLATDHEIVLSTQVLIEFRAVATRKLHPPLPADQLAETLEALAQFEIVGADANLVMDAHALAATHRLAWFDALIIEAAIRSGCDRLYSEDLDHGRNFGRLVVHNPFVESTC